MNRLGAVVTLRVIGHRRIADSTFELALDVRGHIDAVQPGQFLHILVGDGERHVLRRPISIADFEPGVLRIVFRVVGAGTKWLSEQREGSSLDVLGPQGHGFPLPQGLRRGLIVGGGIGVPPLLELAKRLSQRDVRLDVVLGFATASQAFYLEHFALFGAVHAVTEDGSLGTQGIVTDVVQRLHAEESASWSHFFACGPRGMLAGLQTYFRGQDINGYLSLEERMACGVGACQGCVCQTENLLNRRVCTDGPVFDWREVVL